MHESCEEELSWRDISWLSPLWQLLSALERLSSLHPVSVVARKRLDVSFQDLARATRLCIKASLSRGAAGEAVREEERLKLSRAWVTARSNIRCVSLSTCTFNSSSVQQYLWMTFFLFEKCSRTPFFSPWWWRSYPRSGSK